MLRWKTVNGRPTLEGNPRAVFTPADRHFHPLEHDFLPCDLDPPCTSPEVCHLDLHLPVMCRLLREEHE